MKPFLRRAARLLLEIVGVAVGGLLVVAAVATWRISANPVGLSFIRPYVEQEINSAGLGFTVEVTGAKLGWRQFRPLLDLHVHGVKVTGKDGAVVGDLRDATLGLSVRDLLAGRISLVELDIEHPDITIVRDGADHFFLRIDNLGSAGAPDQPASPDSPDLIGQLVQPPASGGAISLLRRVRLVDGTAVIEDRKLGLTWRAPDFDVDIGRDAAGTTARIRVTLDMPRSKAGLAGQAHYVRSDGHVDLALEVRDFDASAAAPLAQMLAPLAPLAVPVSGRVNARIDRTGSLVAGQASLTGGQGRIILPEYYPQPLAFRSIGLDIHFTDMPRRLMLDRLAIDLGDAQLQATGAASFSGPDVRAEATATLSDIPLARFDALWPHGFAVGGRDWVTTHIPEGLVKTGMVKLAASGPTDDPASIHVDRMDGTIDYTGLEVHYFPALPPVRGIAGHGVFDTRHMDLTIDSGMLGDLAVSHGTATLTGFDQDDRAIDIGLSIDGPLKTALTILDMKPLGYAHDLGIAPASVEGRLAARASFAFPLVKTLAFSQIAIGATGTLGDVMIAGVIGPRDVTDGDLSIALDKKGMSLAGNAKLSGVPVALDWKESFVNADRIRSRIGFRTELDDAALAALEFEPPAFIGLHGTIPVTGAVAIDRARTTTLDLSADIGAAALTIDRLGLRKPAGQAGTAAFSLIFAGDTLTRVSGLHIDSHDLTLAGWADFGTDGVFRRAGLGRVADRRNDYSAQIDSVAGDPQHYAVGIKGASFDAAPLLAHKDAASSNTDTSKIDLTVALDHLLTGAESRLDQVSGKLSLVGGALDRADVTAMAGGPMSLVYQPDGDATALRFTAADAGHALDAVGLTRGVRGGTLRIDGQTIRSGGRRRTTGTIDLRDFRLTDAPIAARLLNAVSLTGFVDLLSGQGLAFDRLYSGFDYGDGKIDFRDGRTAGELGISFEGDVDLNRGKLDLKGTIVPVDTLNRILAAIPLIGDVFGGSRGGLLGWTYSVAGTTGDPKVSVNPLSMFAPGFLRNLFFLGPSAAIAPAAANPPGADRPPAKDGPAADR